MKRLLFLLLLLPLCGGCGGERDAEEPVRNVIYMIGDGMGLAQVSLLQIADDYAPTSFDRAQNVGLVVTRSANNRVTDSAAAGTALASGFKTSNGRLGMTPDSLRPLSIMARAHAGGRAAGIVVTCHLQHATPAAFYAHAEHRDDAVSITRDLLACGYDVLMGGGGRWLSEPCDSCGSGFDAFARKGYAVVRSTEQIDTVRRAPLLAVLAEGHLPDAAARGDYLPRAVRKALELLDGRSEKGFVLMVEGSLIDYACHANDAERLVAEMRDFDRAVAEAMDFADRTPGTLVVVVADHETGGLSLPGGNADFLLAESGVECRFSTKGHSGSMVPVYLYGTGADRIRGVMDNTELSRRLMTLVGLDPDGEGTPRSSCAAAGDR